MTRLSAFFVLFLGIIFNLSGQNLKLKQIQFYQNDYAFLTFSGKVELTNKSCFVPLLEDALQETILISAGASNPLTEKLFLNQAESRTENLSSLSDLLITNIGNQVKIEAREGSTSINYEGEILPVQEGSEIVLLKTAYGTEIIPLRQIEHVALDSLGKQQKDVAFSRKSLQLIFKNPSRYADITLSYAVKGLSWNLRYLIQTQEQKLKLLCEVSLINPSITEDGVEIFLINSNFNTTQSTEQNGGFYRLGTQNLQKGANPIRTLFELDYPITNTYLVEKTADLGNKKPLVGQVFGNDLLIKQAIEIFNSTDYNWIAGPLVLQNSSNGLIQHLYMPEKPKKQVLRIELDEKQFVVNDSLEVVSSKPKAEKIDGEFYDLFTLRSKTSVTNIGIVSGNLKLKKALIPSQFSNAVLKTPPADSANGIRIENIELAPGQSKQVEFVYEILIQSNLK